jgi:hypothetical protein
LPGVDGESHRVDHTGENIASFARFVNQNRKKDLDFGLDRWPNATKLSTGKQELFASRGVIHRLSTGYPQPPVDNFFKNNSYLERE